MPITSTDEVETSVDEFGAAIANVQAAVAESTLDEFTGASALLDLRNARDDAVELAGDLAQVDPLTLVATTTAENTINVWRWRYATRTSVMAFIVELGDLIDILELFLKGFNEKVVVSTEADTLQSIAARELGGYEDWPLLLKRNPGLSPVTLEPGTTIVIPNPR